jgi:hypothetical protein
LWPGRRSSHLVRSSPAELASTRSSAGRLHAPVPRKNRRRVWYKRSDQKVGRHGLRRLELESTSEGEAMKRLVTALLAALTLCALPAIASASPYNRSCQGGSLIGKNITQRIHVGMSYRTAASIARRVGVEEFGYHAKPSDVPCDVSESVADNGLRAWTYTWPGDDGTVGASWIGYSRGPYVGRFHCQGYATASGGIQESCTHRADKHAGQITVQFQIVANPYG